MSMIPLLADKLTNRQNLRKTIIQSFNEISTELEQELQEKGNRWIVKFETESDLFKFRIGSNQITFSLEEIKTNMKQNDMSNDIVRNVIEESIFRKLGF